MSPEDKSADKSARERLGRLLAERRVQLAPRYRNKHLFAEERDVNYRMVWRMEAGHPGNYQAKTLRKIEVAYELAPGAIARALAGGELEAAPEPSRAASLPSSDADPLRALYADEPAPGTAEDAGAWTMFPAPGDYALRWLWRTPGAIEQEKIDLIKVLRQHRSGAAGEPPAESAAG